MYSFSFFLCFLLLVCSLSYSWLLKLLLHGMHLISSSVIALAFGATIYALFSSKMSSLIGGSYATLLLVL